MKALKSIVGTNCLQLENNNGITGSQNALSQPITASGNFSAGGCTV